MAAPLRDGQIIATALGDYTLMHTSGAGGNCGYHATLQSLQYLAESSYLRKSEMQKIVESTVVSAHRSQRATVDWLGAEQIAEYLFSIGVQLFVVAVTEKHESNPAKAEGFIVSPSTSACTDWPVLVLVNYREFHWWATRPSTKASISSSGEIVRGIRQPALLEPFEDPRRAIKGRLSQWVLREFVMAKTCYKGPSNIDLNEFLYAYEDVSMSTATVAQKFFCSIMINMPYLGSWARLVKYNGHRAYRPFHEWATHCLARHLYSLRAGETPSDPYEPELYEVVVAQANVRDHAHLSASLQASKAGVVLPEDPRKLPHVWDLAVTRLLRAGLQGWTIQAGKKRVAIQEFTDYPVTFKKFDLHKAYTELVKASVARLGIKIKIFYSQGDISSGVSLASIHDEKGHSEIAALDYVFVFYYARTSREKILAGAPGLAYSSKQHSELQQVDISGFDVDTALLLQLQLMRKISLGLESFVLTANKEYASSLNVRIMKSMLAEMMAGKLLPTSSDFLRCIRKGHFG